MTPFNTIPSDTELAGIIDQMMTKHFKPDAPGAAIIVTRKGKPIFRKGYGMANLEHGIKIEPHMVFRLGSITKQFTAVCTLILMEQGKLDLQDDITKYLPDYPTHGYRITVEHLLTHTSGIKNHTSTPEFGKMMRTDYSLKDFIDTFKPLPMEFAPGTRFNYNNSGFVMLGLVIEKASGMSYADFLKKYIFEPLDMKNTYFDMPNPIIPGRVSGYKPAGDTYENCDYLSMTLPHAAGSLASTVDDMAKWDAALYTEKLVKQESLKKAWTPYTLQDGTSTGYGYGWAVSTFQSYNMIIHGGAISGFMTDGFRFPDEQVYVSILTNREQAIPDNLAFKIGAIAIGKPYQEPAAIPFDPALYKRYQGVYKIRFMDFTIPVQVENDKLYISMPGSGKEEFYPLSVTEFASRKSVNHLCFTFDDNGKANSFIIKGFYGTMLTADITDEPLPTVQIAIEVDQNKLAGLVGEYELAPGMNVPFMLQDGKLIARVPGQGDFSLKAETETKFFLDEIPVTFEFHKDASGKVTGMTLMQSGHAMPAKKVK